MLKTKLKFYFKLIIAVILTLGISISIQSGIAAWQAPTATPPSQPNIFKPINTGSVTQNKLGGLNLGGPLGIADNQAGPHLSINGDGVNPELALRDLNSGNYWSIYSDEISSDELRFWRGGNQMSLTNNGTLKVHQICDETGGNCSLVSGLSAGGGGVGTYIPLTGGTVSLTQSTTGTWTYNIADFTGPGLDTSKITGIFISHYLKQSWDAGGTSYIKVTFPDGSNQYISYYSQGAGDNNFGYDRDVTFIPINAGQTSFSAEIKEVSYTSSDVNYSIIGAKMNSNVGGGGGFGLITCRKDISHSFSGAGSYAFSFNTAECGGTLPDNSYTGVYSNISFCGGETNERVLNSGEISETSFDGNISGPGAFAFVQAPCTWSNGFQGEIEVVYLNSGGGGGSTTCPCGTCWRTQLKNGPTPLIDPITELDKTNAACTICDSVEWVQECTPNGWRQTSHTNCLSWSGCY